MNPRIRTVVVVQHAAGGGAAAQLVVHRHDRVDAIADDLPLGGCGYRGLEVSLQPIETMERRADAIPQQGHDRGRALVVLGSLCLGGCRRGEHAAAAAAAQPIELPGARDEWRLAGDAHDALGLAEPVEPAVRTLRARVADVRAVVRDVSATCMRIRGGADPTVALPLTWRAGIALRCTVSTTVDLGIRGDAVIVAGDAAVVRAIARVAAVVARILAEVIPISGGRRRSLVVGGLRRAGEHGAELLGRADPEEPAQPRERGAPLLQPPPHLDQRVEHALHDRVVLGRPLVARVLEHARGGIEVDHDRLAVAH
jgi:hypothetical protein